MTEALAANLDILLFVTAMALMMAGFPVAFTLAGVALGFAFLGDALGVFRLAQLNFPPQRVWAIMSNSVIVAAPLFVFMGLVLERSRVAEDMLTAMARLFGKRAGGLVIATTLVGALMAASTGIVGVTVVTMGLLALPVMLRNGYAPAFACGAICAAGTLGQIIPPSIVLVFLGDFLTLANQQANLSSGTQTGRSVGVAELFAGCLIPGFMLVALYLAWQALTAWRRPELCPPLPSREAAAIGEAPEASDLALLIRALAAPLLLIAAVLGSILGGVATPTEAAGVGAVGALALAASRESSRARPLLVAGGLAVLVLLALLAAFDLRVARDEIPAADLWAIRAAVALTAVLSAAVAAAVVVTGRSGTLAEVTYRTGRITAMVFTVLMGATLFTLVFRSLGGEDTIREFLHSLPGGLTGAMIFTMALMFALGLFLDFLEITFILVPILGPVLIILGADPVWLGVMIAMNLQTSFLTPPFGFALFYLRGVAPPQVSTLQIWRGAAPYVAIQLVALGLLAAFPAMGTWLPSAIFAR